MNKKNYKHIIWDWNGTLIDDAWLCVDIMNDLLYRRGIPKLTIERYREVFEFPVRNYYKKVGFNFEKEPFEVPGTEFMDGYCKRWQEVQLQENAMGTLKKIYEVGITQSLLSAAKQQLLEEMTDFFQVRDFFIKILGLDDHYAYGKLDIGKKWIKDINCSPHEVLYIGDTVHDYEVANDMGVNCILVSNGHHTAEKLKSCGVLVVDSLHEILSILNR